MKILKTRKFSFYIITILFFFTAAYLLFNEDGILKYISLQNDVKKIKNKIIEVEQENKRLEGEIDSLQRKVPAKVEKIAREKYNMIRKGEKTIKIVEE